MKTLTFTQPHNLSQLHDELLSIEALKPVPGASGRNEAVIRVEGKDDVITLSVPDDADEGAIQAIIDAHSPRAIPAPVDRAVLKQRVRSATSLPELRDAVLELL